MVQKIMVVDDDPYAVKGTMDLLTAKYEVFPAYTSSDMLGLLRAHTFDLVILDLALGKREHGLDWVAQIQKTKAKVLVLTTLADEESIFGCLRAAVDGILLKQDGPTYLLPAVEGALAGYNMTNPKLVARFTEPQNHLPYMSWQERDLVNFLFANPHATNAAIGLHLNLTEGTVKNKLSKLFQKFAVHKRHQFLEEARRRGYRPVDPDDTDAEKDDAALALAEAVS